MNGCSRAESDRRLHCGKRRCRCGKRSGGLRLTTGLGLFFKASGSELIADWRLPVADLFTDHKHLRQLAIDESTARLKRIQESDQVRSFLICENEVQAFLVVEHHVS